MAENDYLEVSFPLAGKTFRVRPTYRITARIEGIMGVAAKELGLRCAAWAMPPSARGGIRELQFSEMATLLGIILDGVPNAPQPEDIGEILMDDGCVELYKPMMDFLMRGQKGNKEYAREQLAALERAKKAEAEGEATPEDGGENPPASQDGAQAA